MIKHIFTIALSDRAQLVMERAADATPYKVINYYVTQGMRINSRAKFVSDCIRVNFIGPDGDLWHGKRVSRDDKSFECAKIIDQKKAISEQARKVGAI